MSAAFTMSAAKAALVLADREAASRRGSAARGRRQ